VTNSKPTNLLLRDAQPSDADAVARVHVLTWQNAYRGLLPDAYLDALRPEERARRYTFGGADPSAPRTLVALVGAELVGFATVCVAREEGAPAELSALHVQPSQWGQGIGAALIAAARARLVREGCRAARLWLLEGNARAERFYRIDGWVPEGTRREEVVWGAAVVEIGFRRALP
jgi:GNAT superfamily N-acetyltransferase